MSYLTRDPNNIVHLDLAAGGGSGDLGGRYQGAAALMTSQRQRGVLRSTPESYFAYEFRYRLDDRARVTRGIFCAMDLEPWGGDVLPHEETMAGPVEDRLQLLRSTRAHLSGIYGTVAGPCSELADLLSNLSRTPAPFEVRDGEGVEHRMWPVPAETPVDRWLADEPLLIADGHHRYTTGLAYREERHAAEGPGPWDRILTLVVDAGSQDVPVLPYHRVQLHGPVPDGGDAMPDLAGLLRGLDDEHLRYGIAQAGTGPELSYRLHVLDGEPPTVDALHSAVLDTAAPGGALVFTHDAGDAVALVRSGEAVAAYLLPPTTPDRIRHVIEQGRRLPRKSTFFWPKPRTGMVMMPLDPP